MGVGESIKGRIKETAGDVLGDEKLKAEGDAQEKKGEEQEREVRARSEARAHEEKAADLDREQRLLED